jgi:hypothetical protein
MPTEWLFAGEHRRSGRRVRPTHPSVPIGGEAMDRSPRLAKMGPPHRHGIENGTPEREREFGRIASMLSRSD